MKQTSVHEVGSRGVISYLRVVNGKVYPMTEAEYEDAMDARRKRIVGWVCVVAVFLFGFLFGLYL